jgi:hypothetical protein
VQFSAASWQKPEITHSHSNVAEHPSLLGFEGELLDEQFQTLQTITVLQYREKGELCLDCLTLMKKTQQSLMSETTWLMTQHLILGDKNLQEHTHSRNSHAKT